MNIMLKLNHLIGMLVLKVLESLLEKKKKKQSALCASPGRIQGRRHSLGELQPPPNFGVF